MVFLKYILENKLGDSGMKYIGENLSGLKGLTTLTVGTNGITPNGIKNIAIYFSCLPKLEIIGLERII